MGVRKDSHWLAGRGYLMWEDADMTYFASNYNLDGFEKEIILERHLRFRDYVNYRFIKNPHGVVGFKGPATYWCTDWKPENLPILTVNIDRPLEDSIKGDIRTGQEVTAESNPQFAESIKVNEKKWRVLRAASLAACYQAKQDLFALHPPVFSVDFYDLLADPEPQIDALCEVVSKLGHDPTLEQQAEALRSVDPNKRHI